MTAPPISAELWERLRRFDQRGCSISITRGEPYSHKLRNSGALRTRQVSAGVSATAGGHRQ